MGIVLGEGWAARWRSGRRRKRSAARSSGPAWTSAYTQRGGEHRSPSSRLWSALSRAVLVCLLSLSASAAWSQTAPGTPIINTATVDYQTEIGSPRQVATNAVQTVVAIGRTPAEAAFIRALPDANSATLLGTTACLTGGAEVALPAPSAPGGAAIPADSPVSLATTTLFAVGEPAFVRVIDLDQNLDPATRDTVVVTVASSTDSEQIRLVETSTDSGEFVGYVQLVDNAAASGDCVLSAPSADQLQLDYVDAVDADDAVAALASTNAFNSVFDAFSGLPVGDVTITLVDAATGLPATVFGNDGVSAFPATVRSGDSVTDASGLVYAVPEAGFIFPTVPAGRYRLVIEPPANFLAPSNVAPSELAALPGGPFVIGDASFARDFELLVGEPFRFDVPVDPTSGGLFLTKNTTTQTAAPGDFIPYRLSLENTSDVSPALNVTLADALPPGLILVDDTVTIDGLVVDAAERTDSGFTVDLGTLGPNESVEISYLVEVTGGARGEQLVNAATATTDRGIVSNEATAAVRLRDDLFRDRATIIGRVLESDCSERTFDESDGVAGIRLYMEDGRYAVTDESGRFHFEGVAVGLHAVQVDDATVPDYLNLEPCLVDARRAGSARSMFIDARGGAIHRADFFLRRKPANVGRVDIELENVPGKSAELIDYRVRLTGVGDFPVENLTVTSVLPDGVRFLNGSASLLSGASVNAKASGRAVVFRLGERNGVWEETLAFSARAAPTTEGELETRTVASFDTPAENGKRTPAVTTVMQRTAAANASADYVLSLKFGVLSAELAPSDRAELDTVIASWRGVREIEVNATGHSDNVPIAARNREVFADNYALSQARAQAVVDYLAAALPIDAERIVVRGLGPDRPVASNDEASGRRQNRRVELVMTGSRPARQAALATRIERSAPEAVQTRGAIPGPAGSGTRNVAGPASVEAILAAQKTPLPTADSLSPGIDWVQPISDFRPAIPSIRVAVQHGPTDTVTLSVNGTRVPELSFDGKSVGRLSGVALSTWRAVRLDEGRNTLTATVRNADGDVIDSLERTVHFAGGPLRGEWVPEASYLVADGQQRPVIAIRLFDGDGELARTGSVGRFQVDAPYRSWWEVRTSRENNLVAIGEREPLYRIEPDGIARIELEPTTVAGEVVVRLAYENQREQEIRVWLTPEPRDWILVALAEGTAAYNRVSDNMQAAEAAGLEPDYVEDGRVAFFAKGRIRGDALLTVAYDTRGAAENFNQFENVIDPNAFYTLYADGTESRFEAASQRKLYLKLEREQLALLFGDYATGLAVTDLARYERQFNGSKVSYNGTHLQLTAFGADTAQRFSRDELRGNGTSGLYQLSNTNVLLNSEVVSIEVRDRFDASEVVTSTTLTRFVDYSIDYARGTLLFKRPIASRDDAFNPQFIVVNYETNGGDGEVTSGGRVALRTSDASLEVGATVIREAQQNGDGDLLAADLTWQATPATTVRAEYADSTSNDTPSERRGHGYRVEVEHRTGRADIEAYHARVEPEFGLGQQNVSEIGLEKSGINGRVRVSESVQVLAEVVRQENLDTALVRDLANVTVNATLGQFSADIGIVHASDETATGESRESTLGRLSLAQSILDNRTSLRLTAEAPLNDNDAVADYPGRVLAGLDVALGRTATAFVEHEIADGDALASDMTRVGLRAQPWQRTRFDSTLTQEVGEFGPRLFATVGAVQGWQIAEKWTVDVGVDQSNTLQDPTAIVFDSEREFVSGSQSEDFFAAHIGSAYAGTDWTANVRAEHRNADTSEALNVIGGLYRQTVAGHGLSAALEWFEQTLPLNASSTRANLRIGWAYRMANQRLAFLNRSDVIVDEQVSAMGALESWRIVNNFAANWRLSARDEVNMNVGVKFVRGEYDGLSQDGLTTLTGAEWRRSVTPRWDIGLHGDIYRSWRSDVSDYSAGVSVGFTVADNTRLTLGYNVVGFDDPDFSLGNYTVAGPYLRFVLKADQETLKRLAGITER
ncbi:MAG: OmpA family protein [Pseudomonadota bacterium]